MVLVLDQPFLDPYQLLPHHYQSSMHVDDHSCAVKIDLKKALVKDPVERQKPLDYHERTGHILPSNSNAL